VALREVLAELDVLVRGNPDVQRANALVDQLTATVAGPTNAALETFRVRQAEAAEMASRLGNRIRALQRSGSANAQQIEELRRAQLRATDEAARYGSQVDRLRRAQEQLARVQDRLEDQARAEIATRRAGGAELARVQDRLEQQARAEIDARREGAIAADRTAAASRGMGAAMGEAAAVVGTAAAVAGTAYAAYSQLADAIGQVIERGDQIAAASTRLGLSARALQEWQYVAERTDVSADALEGAFGRLARNAEAARAGTGPAAAAWRELHVRVRDASGGLRSQEAIFSDTISALSRVEDRTHRAALAQQLFGRQGTELLGLIDAGPERIDELRARFAELGGGLSQDVVDGASAADDAMRDFDLAMESLTGSLAVSVLPGIARGIEAFATWIARFSELARTSSLVETAIGGLAAALVALVAVTAPVTIPTLLAAGSLLVLFLAIEDVVTAFRGGESVFGSWVEWITSLTGHSFTFATQVEAIGVAWDQAVARGSEGLASLLEQAAAVQSALGIGDGELAAAAGSARTQAGIARAQATRSLGELAQREQERQAARIAGPPPATVEGAAARARGRTAEATTVDQRTSIVIHGATDPQAVGREVDRVLRERQREALDTLPLAPEPA
jgi:hypothetical protein